MLVNRLSTQRTCSYAVATVFAFPAHEMTLEADSDVNLFGDCREPFTVTLRARFQGHFSIGVLRR